MNKKVPLKKSGSTTLLSELSKKDMLDQSDINVFMVAWGNQNDKEGIEILSIGDPNHPKSLPIHKVSRDLLVYAAQPTSFNVDEYFIDRGILPMTVARLRKIEPFFDQCYTLAREKIGLRRERLAAFRKIDPNFGYKSQPIHSEQYIELRKWEQSITKITEDFKQELTVILKRGDGREQFKHSGSVDGSDSRSELGDKDTSGETQAEGTST